MTKEPEKQQPAAGESRELATQGGAPELPAYLTQYAEQPGSNELARIDGEETVRPSIHLCQALSPEVKDGSAKDGDFVARPLGESLGRKFMGLIVGRAIRHILWRPRNDKELKANRDLVHKDYRTVYTVGRGFVFSKLPSQLTAPELEMSAWSGKDDEAQTPPLVTQHYLFAVIPVYPNGRPMYHSPLTIDMSRTSAKCGRVTMGMLQLSNVPVWSRAFQFTSVQRSEKGIGEWNQWGVQPSNVFVSAQYAATAASIFQRINSRADEIQATEPVDAAN